MTDDAFSPTSTEQTTDTSMSHRQVPKTPSSSSDDTSWFEQERQRIEQEYRQLGEDLKGKKAETMAKQYLDQIKINRDDWIEQGYITSVQVEAKSADEVGEIPLVRVMPGVV
jgi:hypothetical protein